MAKPKVKQKNEKKFIKLGSVPAHRALAYVQWQQCTTSQQQAVCTVNNHSFHKIVQLLSKHYRAVLNSHQ